jgi:hypothetical protein
VETETTNGRNKDARPRATNGPRLFYLPRGDATPEGELCALAAVYAYVLERHEQKEMAAKVGDYGVEAEVGRAGGPPEERLDDGGRSA